MTNQSLQGDRVSFPYDREKDHILFVHEGRNIFLDTGSPSSIGDGAISFGNDTWDFQNNFMGLTTASLSEMAGIRIDVLLGMDVLSQRAVIIDSQKGLVHFRKEEEPDFGVALPIMDFMGAPLMDIAIDGRRQSVFFDTGAQLSYMEPELAQGKQPIARKQDFYPTFGAFETDVYKMDVEFGGFRREIDFGILPELLRLMLTMAQGRGILGTQALEALSCQLIMAKKQLFFKEHS